MHPDHASMGYYRYFRESYKGEVRRIPIPRTPGNKQKLAPLEDASLSLRCYSCLCDIKTASMGRGQYG